MAETQPSQTEIVEALSVTAELQFELPDPHDEEIEEEEFFRRVDDVWRVCDRFDLQTDIWRGRILRAVRDREKIGGEGRGSGFLNWLKQKDITKSQAYALIQLANSADALLAEGNLSFEAINNFSKRAFLETAKAQPEIQKLVGEEAKKGKRITRREVKQLTEEYTAINSELLPDTVKEKAVDGSLPPRHLAPLVKELEKLPPPQVEEIQREIESNPYLDTVKQMTSTAKSLSRYFDAVARVETLKNSPVDISAALEEAMRLDCLSLTADLVKQATQLEQVVVKLYTLWKKLGGLADRLYVETGSSTPNLRSLLSCLEKLTGEVIEVPLDQQGCKSIRLRIVGD
ncbi:MAG: hypothetical protein NZ901_01595 [Geminocystis sp.]|nr:hypothetical protein [Geminocystis sp.]HIK36773.1 hypothetical protein [Geminocystis sp. M7585_C2015_104]MCS7146863.1 hypothetical protein [Geminocystis sp.]MCX8078883.1 hypothetical protein [Geminocystis sp.]MDW8115688.1 hypothetical protein [Geminocystis sp.]